MPLPTLSKTWQISANQTVAAQGTLAATAQRLLRTVKNLFIAPASSPWTVSGSSNSGAAGMDSTDRWITDNNITPANSGTAHSWIVLRQTGIASNFEICLDYNTSNLNPHNISVIVSPSAGFTGGTVTNRPTATDEQVMINTNSWFSSLNIQHQIHFWQSSDGQCTRLMIWRQNTNMCTFWSFDKPKDPVSGWTNPSAWIVINNTGGISASTGLFTTLAAGVARGHGTAAMTLALTGEGAGDTGALLAFITPTGTQANSLDSNWPFFPIGLASSTSSHIGRHGSLYDIWWAPSGLSNADTFPNDTANRQFVKMGALILPWLNDSTIPLIT